MLIEETPLKTEAESGWTLPQARRPQQLEEARKDPSQALRETPGCWMIDSRTEENTFLFAQPWQPGRAEYKPLWAEGGFVPLGDQGPDGAHPARE